METHLKTWPSRLLARPWLAAFVPINAATSGFGVILPLLILISLHGGWVDVAVAATLFNVAVVVASIVWGHLSDRYPRRRLFLLLNYAGFGVVYLAIAAAPSVGAVFVLYTVIGLLTPAGTSASNLLILEKFPVVERANAYASLQEMSMIGAIGGLLLGFFWLVAARPLAPLLVVMAGLAFVSVLAVAIGIRDSPHPTTTRHVAHAPEGLASRLHFLGTGRISVPFFPTRPQLNRAGVRRFRRWVKLELRQELALLLGASALFNLSSNLFNISYTPYLFALGIGAASIFLVNFANNLAQGIAFPFSGGLNGRWGADALVQRATYARSVGYLAVAGLTFVPILGVSLAFGANAILFGILGGGIALYSTASSMILFRALEGKDAGTILGLNSALGGVAAIGGAALSGLLSYLGSYRLVFLVSAGALLVSLPLWSAAQVAYLERRTGGPAPVASAPPSGRSSVPVPQTD